MESPAVEMTARNLSGAVLVMGSARCGKSTLVASCTQSLGAALAEGDTFYRPAKLFKMLACAVLTDADSVSWLTAVAAQLRMS